MSVIKLSQIDSRETKKITLPESGVEITLYTSLLWGSSMSMKEDDPIGTGRKILVELIKEWNVVDDHNVQIPVSIDLIDKLPMKDGLFLMREMTSITEEMKEKKSA